MNSRILPFHLADVFTAEPLSGNGLSLFLLDEALPARVMHRVTREMRQFETIFLGRTEQPAVFDARIFTMEEELPFAGHPVIGAAALLHSECFSTDEVANLKFVMRDRSIDVVSRRHGLTFVAEMDQGPATLYPPISAAKQEIFLRSLNLSEANLTPGLPLQVVSTGLPYLIVPIVSGLEQARILVPDFEALLESEGARFVYVFDVSHLEGRTWDNDGRVEDVATGSAAGPAAAYLVWHERALAGERLVLRQGRFLERPSEIYATVQAGAGLNVAISGQVCLVGQGELRLPKNRKTGTDLFNR